jgi:hypothetical protein
LAQGDFSDLWVGLLPVLVLVYFIHFPHELGFVLCAVDEFFSLDGRLVVVGEGVGQLLQDLFFQVGLLLLQFGQG